MTKSTSARKDKDTFWLEDETFIHKADAHTEVGIGGRKRFFSASSSVIVSSLVIGPSSFA
jgi:hypothetical protein